MARLTTVIPKSRFLGALSFVYLFAFSSIYIQLPGLYGDNGISPVRILKLTAPTSFRDFFDEPNLLRLSRFLNLEVFRMLELCVVVGVIISFLACFWERFRTLPVYLTLWLAYFSVFKVGQTFLWFQWDLLLIEAGFISIFLAKASPGYSFSSASDRVSLWLLRWLLFRLMFSAGVVKLTSNCPAWWNLQALHWHYQSQCIPTPMAWYFHHLPGWFHSVSVASALIIEIIVPLLFFVPLRAVRLFCFYTQVLLQALIILTGNYNFFNFLTCALCYSLLKDADFYSYKKKSSGISAMISSLCAWFLILGTLVVGACLFNFRFTSDFSLASSIGFTKNQFNRFLTHSIANIFYVAVAAYLFEVLLSIVCALRARTGCRKISELIGVVVIGIVGLGLLFGSFVPLASLDQQTRTNLPDSAIRMYQRLRPYHLVNGYGLFRRITGIGGRPELILEAAPTENGPWMEYHFRFKPGAVNRIPPIVAPHQPRLDWQMWFAALGQPDGHPWLYNLIYRLLQRQSDVLSLLDSTNSPRDARFIRAELYTYHFTSPEDRTGAWWRRVHKSTYLPPLSFSSPSLLSAVQRSGLTMTGHHGFKDSTPLSMALKRLRAYIGQPPDLTPLLVLCLVLWITKRGLLNASTAV